MFPLRREDLRSKSDHEHLDPRNEDLNATLEPEDCVSNLVRGFINVRIAKQSELLGFIFPERKINPYIIVLHSHVLLGYSWVGNVEIVSAFDAPSQDIYVSVRVH